MADSKAAKKGYSTLDPNFLCVRCTNGIVMESAQGQTDVRCARSHYGTPFPVTMLVAACSDYNERKSSTDPTIDKDGIVSLMFLDGHIVRREWTAVGQRWVRCFDDDGRPLDVQVAIQMEVDRVRAEGKKRGVDIEKDDD